MRSVVSGLIFISFLQGVAQQSLFNVPSSDITEEKKIFFQQQLNFSKDQFQSNSTFVWGFKRNFEAGINVLGVNILTHDFQLDYNTNLKRNPVYPFIAINAQKAFLLNKHFKMALGTQTGIAAGWHLGSYNYLNLVSVLQKTRTKLITGLFSATDSFIGFGERNPFLLKDVIGCQLGIEQELLHETLFLIAENITGKHNLGESSIGVAWYILPHWSISLAHQFSNPASGTLRATVLEITYVPSAHLHKRLFRKGHL